MTEILDSKSRVKSAVLLMKVLITKTDFFGVQIWLPHPSQPLGQFDSQGQSDIWFKKLRFIRTRFHEPVRQEISSREQFEWQYGSVPQFWRQRAKSTRQISAHSSYKSKSLNFHSELLNHVLMLVMVHNLWKNYADDSDSLLCHQHL